MKKLLGLLTLSVLVTTQLPFNTINIKNPNHNLQNISNNLKAKNDRNLIYPKNINAQVLAVTPNAAQFPGTIFAGNSNGKVYKQAVGDSFFAIPGTSGEIKSLAVAPNGTVYAGNSNGKVFYSIGGMVHFELATGTSGSIVGLAVAPNGTVWAISSGGNLYKSTNGRDFVYIKSKHQGAKNSITVTPNGTIYTGGVNGSLYKSTDGINFSETSGIKGYAAILSVTSTSNNIVYAGSSDGKVYKSNNGNNFEEVKGVSGQIKSLTVSNDGLIYAGSSNGLFKSINGNNFSRIKETSKDVNSVVLDRDESPYIAENNSIFQLKNELDWFKEQIQFTLIDPTKTISWVSNENLTASGKLNGHIENNSINFIQVNGQTLPQTNKVWDFEVGEEGKNIDYYININFTFNNEVYNVEMIVSILMDNPKIAIKTNQGELINQYSTILPGAEKVNDISTSTPIYYSKTEALVSLLKPTWASSLTGIVSGLNADWQKNGQSQSIAEKDTFNIDGSQLGAYDGRYIIETTDDAGNKESYYAVVIDDETQKPISFWDTEDGKYFFEYAKINGFDGNKLKDFNSKEINDLISQSLEWENDLANDQQILAALVSNISENLNIGTSSFISNEEVLKKIKDLVPNQLEIPGYFTNLYNSNNVVVDLENSNEGFGIGDTVTFKISYQGETSENLSFTIKEVTEPTSNWVKFIFIIAVVVTAGALGFFGYKMVSKKLKDKRTKEHVARETNQNKTEEEVIN